MVDRHRLATRPDDRVEMDIDDIVKAVPIALLLAAFAALAAAALFFMPG